MTVREAIDSFTSAGAWASFDEGRKGRIRPGMLADFVVLERDPFQTAPEELAGVGVLATYVGGTCVYHR